MKMFTYIGMKKIFDLLELAKNKKMDDRYHPEHYLLSHLIQTMDLGFKHTNDIDLILGALLHDIGKIESNGYYRHAYVGARLVKDCVSFKTCWLIRYHMFLADTRNTKYADYDLNYVMYHPWKPLLVKLRQWDIKGRKNIDVVYDPIDIINRLNKKRFKNLRGGQ